MGPVSRGRRLIVPRHFDKLLLSFEVLVGQVELVNIGVHDIGPIVFVSLVTGHHDELRLVQVLVTNPHRKPKVEVEQARLAHVF